MRIAIIGNLGFVGSNIQRYLVSSSLSVVGINRSNLNVLDFIKVQKFLKKSKFDVIINAAAMMSDQDNLDDTRNNLGLFMNFYNNSDYFGKFINLGSGAEFDRTKSIDNAKESDIINILPQDSYGFGQNIKSRVCCEKGNFYTLRIFNCFGRGEISSRIFPKILNAQGSINIVDKYFDYFYIKDLCKVVEYFVLNDDIYKDINCVYMEKTKISKVVDKFCEYQGLSQTSRIVEQSDKNYTGDGSRLQNLPIDLFGLDYGLKNYGN